MSGWINSMSYNNPSPGWPVVHARLSDSLLSSYGLIFIVAKGNGEPGIFLHLGDYEGNQAIRHRFYDTWYGTAQKTDPFLEDLLRTYASLRLKTVLMHPDSFHYQLIYTQIDRDSHNQPHFHNYYYRWMPWNTLILPAQ